MFSKSYPQGPWGDAWGGVHFLLCYPLEAPGKVRVGFCVGWMCFGGFLDWFTYFRGYLWSTNSFDRATLSKWPTSGTSWVSWEFVLTSFCGGGWASCTLPCSLLLSYLVRLLRQSYVIIGDSEGADSSITHPHPLANLELTGYLESLFCPEMPWFLLYGPVVSNINEHCESALHSQSAHTMATTAGFYFYLPIGRRGAVPLGIVLTRAVAFKRPRNLTRTICLTLPSAHLSPTLL